MMTLSTNIHTWRSVYFLHLSVCNAQHQNNFNAMQVDTEATCVAKGCCYDASRNDIPCFYGDGDAVPITQVYVVGGHSAHGKDPQCAAANNMYVSRGFAGCGTFALRIAAHQPTLECIADPSMPLRRR